jgi:diguanylate cyclase (GGDEF)-like protein
MLVLPGADAAAAVQRCEELRQLIRSYPWSPITGAVAVTTSIGVTTSPDGSGVLAALLAQADRRLYAAKHAGRDRVMGRDAT